MSSSPLRGFLRSDDDAQMTLIEHLDELRWRILKIAVAFVVASVVAWFFVSPIYNFLVAPGGDILDGTLSFRSPTEPLFTDFKLALYTGLMVTLPILFYQTWAFVAPAVGEMGRIFTYTLISMASGLFVAGVAFGYFFVLPVGLNFLLSWGADRYEQIITAQEYLRFVTRLLLAFGVAFEVPAATFVGAKLGLIDADVMKKYRRHAIMVNAILAAIITPADPFSMIMLAIPLIFLYEASIFIAARVNPVTEETLPEALERDEELAEEEEEERDRVSRDL